MTQKQLFDDEKAESAQNVVSVLVPYPIDKAYDYVVSDGEDYQPGDYVIVPLGGREISAVVWGDAAGDVDPRKLKSIVAKHKAKPMVKAVRDFIDWVADYTLTPRGFVLKMALSVPAGLDPPKPAKGYEIERDVGDVKLTEKQGFVRDVLSDGVARIAADIAREAGVSSGVVKGVLGKGIIKEVDIFNPAPCKKPDPFLDGFDLSEDQSSVADILIKGVKAEAYQAYLLDGVTGAGKTEVYFEAVAAALKKGKQVLILLPEIALSNAFLDRFQRRFGCLPALWHSGLSTGARRTIWRGVAEGHSKVVIGARSALFLPYQDLGLIVVDEEHDPAYKQEDGVIYHARDMAVVRAHMGHFPIVLVSATPSLETIHNAWNGRYQHLTMADRYGGARMPSIDVIDMRADKPESQHFISPTLLESIKDTIRNGSQSLLFLNRRGYAPLTICRTCGHRVECPRCTAWLVEHKRAGKLQCHHCGYSSRPLRICSECGDKDSFSACGPGVERIYDEIKMHFPDANILMMASDSADNQDDLRVMLDDIRENKVDIIIGTQIIAKGHHFSNLTLVGVVDADLGLTGGELRAAERCYQLLHQVAGRAGRAEKPGQVLLQTYMPEHRIMQALAHGGRDAFLETETFEREAAQMPPFSRLVGIIISGRDEGQVVQVAKALGQTAPQGEAIMTLGPAPAPFARLRGKFRYRLLVRADKALNVQKTIGEWVKAVKCPSTVRIYIDIDPQSFL